MRVAEILSRKDRLIRKARSVDRLAVAAETLTRYRIGALLVFDPWGRYAGILSERNIVGALAQFGGAALDLEVGEVMTPDVVTCQANDHVHKAMQLMTAHRMRHLPVESGDKIVGIISIGDVVASLLGEKLLEVDVLRDMARVREGGA